MAFCEMCGREAILSLTEVEGGELRVCPNCAKYGKIKEGRPLLAKSVSKHAFPAREIPEFKVIDNYSALIRSAREKKGLSQEDFARLLNERESIVAKWEQGGIKPRLGIARKLEKILGIKLVERDESAPVDTPSAKKRSDELTLGDFVKIRKRY